MVATTAIYSFIFSLSYVLSRSLWSAISVHATSNILLHTVFGLDGMHRAMFVPISYGSPTNFDLGFWAMIMSGLAMAALLYLRVSYKLKTVERSELLM